MDKKIGKYQLVAVVRDIKQKCSSFIPSNLPRWT